MSQSEYYHVKRTGLSRAVILTTGTSKRYAVDQSKKNCLVDLPGRVYYMPSNSLPPLEVIQNIVVQIFILLNN